MLESLDGYYIRLPFPIIIEKNNSIIDVTSLIKQNYQIYILDNHKNLQTTIFMMLRGIF